MSHIHLPDGVLPFWLWASGYILTFLIGSILFLFKVRKDLIRRLPLLGMMSGIMVLGASVEIVPIAYHVNLTSISGILLGPSLIFIATFLVNTILALFGHGGVTVIGLNTIILSFEGVFAYIFFRLLWRMLKRLIPSIFIATFLALLLSTLSMIGIVRLGVPHYEELIHQGKGVLEFKLLKEKSDEHEVRHEKEEVNFKRFIMIILPLSFVGWLLEAIITSLIAQYIHRLRPDLIGLD